MCSLSGILQTLGVFWWDGAPRELPPAPGQRGTEGLQPGTVTHQPLHSPPRVGCTRLNRTIRAPVLIPPVSHQPLGEMLSPAQLSPLGGSGHPSLHSGRCRAVTCGSHITAAWPDSKRRSDPSCPPLLCQELEFSRKELAA